MPIAILRTIVALIIILGHLGVFAGGLTVGLLALENSDALQTILIASPVLAVTAASAVRFVLSDESNAPSVPTKKAGFAFSIITIFFPIALLIAIAIVFWATYRKFNGFGPDNMKVTLGGIETFFGAYLGAISDKLFGGSGNKG